MDSMLYFVVTVLLPMFILDQIANLRSPLFRCGENEILTRGSCVETCYNRPTICNLASKFGCFCKDGYVHQSNVAGSPCIKREKCQPPPGTPACGENEEYTDCVTTCSPTCSDLTYPLPKPIKYCILSCKIGCTYKKDFYRSADGKCVPPQQCCGDNEIFQACGSSCVETCQQKPTLGTRQCVRGCFCTCSHYVRQNNNTGSPCIPRDECQVGYKQ